VERDSEVTRMVSFKSIDECQRWIDSQDWYQTIELSNGLVTPGKFDTRTRFKFFADIDFGGKRFLDIGCNSGQYCLMAKKQGAAEVIGIDINDKRLKQARALAIIENCRIRYIHKSLFEASELGEFDIVFCLAVLTEIQDIFGAIESLKLVVGKYAFIELDLAKPIVYVSKSRTWLKGKARLPRRKAVAEVRPSKHGWMISPSLEVISAVFGEEYSLQHLGRGTRYDMVKVVKDS
jgi:SAM-dependent methyltransferase